MGIVEDLQYESRAAIRIYKGHNITISHLTARYAAQHGIDVLGDNFIADSCELKFNGKAGICAAARRTSTATTPW